MPTYRLLVNDVSHSVDSWDPAQPLLYVLRNALGLHGAEVRLRPRPVRRLHGALDGKAVRSCTLPVQPRGRQGITTLEGLGTPEKPDPVQAAFIAEQAAQCGYCTNGMIMAAKALLSADPKPTLDRSSRRSPATCAAAARTRASCAR